METGEQNSWPETIWTKKFTFEPQNGPKFTKVMGVELAPLRIPWKRRMETLSVAFWASGYFMATVIAIYLIYLALFTPYYWVTLAIAGWCFYDKNTPKRGGRGLKWFRKLGIWNRYVGYFPVRLVKTTTLDPSKNYLFASHPHGIICCGAWGAFATEGAGFGEKFPGLRPHMLTLDMNFSLPLYREYTMAAGTCSASRESMNYLLSRPGGGEIAIIVPGGAKESFYARPGHEYVLYLKERKGFVKVALENGSPLVPTFSFGEIDIFDQYSQDDGESKMRKFQRLMQRLTGVAPVIVKGRGMFQYSYGYLPQRKPITVVVGAPIPLEKTVKPSQELVDEVHQKYVQSLTALFEKYKGRYGDPHSYLKIV